MQKPDSIPDWPANFPKFLDNIDSDRFANRTLVIMLVYALIRGLVGAATRPFWYDEVCTWIVARQPTISGIWNALAHGADGQAPGFYLIERLSAALIRNEEVALRLPLILGFLCVTICVFVFTRRRAGPAIALVCASIPFATLLFNWYAIEARPYSLAVACIALALVAYQRAPSAGWMVVMAVALAASPALNYYSLFAFAPFGLAELDVFLTRRQIRWSVWIALGCGVAPMAFFWPLLANFKHLYGEHFWARASLSGLIHIYGTFFLTSPPMGAAIAAAALLGLLALIAFRATAPADAASEPATPPHEYVLTLTLVGLPAIGFLAARLTHSGMTERYVLSAILGIPLAASYILPLLDRRSFVLVVGALVALLAIQEASFWVAHKHQLVGFDSPADSLERFVESAGYSDLPVAISDGLEYLPIAHYAAPPWSERFVALVDAPASIVYAGDDTLDKELTVRRSFAALRVYEFPVFAAEHSAFLLYSSNGSGGDPHDWWTARLLHDGYALKALAVDHSRVIYLATRPSQHR